MEQKEEIKYCKRCHRKLKDNQSKQLGYGKICYSKINKKEALYLFDIEVINKNEIIPLLITRSSIIALIQLSILLNFWQLERDGIPGLAPSNQFLITLCSGVSQQTYRHIQCFKSIAF